MPSWTDSSIATIVLYTLLVFVLQHCSGKSYYTSSNEHIKMFAEQLRKDTRPIGGAAAKARAGGQGGAMLDALLGGSMSRSRDATDLSKMMYGNTVESNMAYKTFNQDSPPNMGVFKNDPEYQHFLQSNEIPEAPVEPPYWAAPKYMIELYNKFETDRYSHPMANIVRSFVNIFEDPSVKSRGNKSKTEMRRHVMKFNISSVSRDEEIHLAELRLYTLVEADRKTYFGNDRRVSIYEVLDEDESVNNNVLQHDLVASKDNVYGRQNGVETFTITDPVKKWVRNDVEMKTLEVRIETIKTRFFAPDIDIDIDTNPHQENEPLLVVFSNDKKKRKSEQRELHEMFMHYASDIQEELGDDYEDDYDYIDDQEDHGVYKRDTHSMLDRLQKSTSVDNNTLDVNSSTFHQESRFTSSNRQDVNIDTKRQKTVKEMSKRQKLKKLYKNIIEMTEDEDTIESRNMTLSRVRRSKVKKKKAHRGSCRRKPLQVKFRDIKWDSWIIAPKSYDAYECTGRCYFPMNDHLTPTKHAIIQTLLHTNFPNKANRACCVPTKLDPISILYVDEKGVVTYKYKYEGMIVAQCGCR